MSSRLIKPITIEREEAGAALGTGTLSDVEVVDGHLQLQVDSFVDGTDDTFNATSLTSGEYSVRYQHIKTNRSFLLSKIKIKTRNSGTYTVTLYDDSLQILYTDTISGAPSNTWITYTLNTPIVLDNDTHYILGMERPLAPLYREQVDYKGILWNSLGWSVGSSIDSEIESPRTLAVGFVEGIRSYKPSGYRIWPVLNSSACREVEGSLVQFVKNQPAGTELKVYALKTTSDVEPDPADPNWAEQTSGQPLTVISVGEDLDGKRIWTKIAASTTDPAVTPTLSLLRVEINGQQILTTLGDGLMIGAAETSNAMEPKYSSDQLMVFVAEEDIQVVFRALDQLKLAFAERSQLNNIHSAMDARERKIFGRVEITYTDPFMDESIEATATETGRHSSPAAVADNITAPPYKWFSLHRNKLDGSYHPMPGSDPGRVGWWGETLSDENGEFADPPMLTLVFDPRPVQELRLVGDAMLQEFPVDFEISLYDPENNLLHLETVTGNTEADWRKSVSFENVAKMELEIQKINRPGSVVKILECFTAVIEIYEGKDIISLNLVEEREPQGATIPIGNISANELTVRLNNLDRRFDPGNPDSRLRGMLKKNRRMRAWLGAEIEPGLVEWYPLGVFWTQNWSTPENELWAETYGWDRLEFLRNTDFSTSEVYQNKSLGWLAERVLQDAGLRPEEYRIDPELYAIIVPYAWFDRMSHRRALELIAAAAIGQVYCDREGIIVVEVFRPSPVSKFEFNEDNIYNKDHPLDWGKLINYVEVRATPRVPGPEEVVYQDTETFTIPAGEKITRTHIFNFTPVVDAQEPVITAGPEIQVKEYTAYAWGMEAVYQNVGLTDQEVESIEIRGKKLEPAGGKIAIAQDVTSIRDNGKQALSEPVTSEFIQTQARAQQIADTLLAAYKDPRRDITLDARGNIALRLGDRVTAPDYRDQVKGDYYILRQELTFDGGLRARVEAQKIAGEE